MEAQVSMEPPDPMYAWTSLFVIVTLSHPNSSSGDNTQSVKELTPRALWNPVGKLVTQLAFLFIGETEAQKGHGPFEIFLNILVKYGSYFVKY